MQLTVDLDEWFFMALEQAASTLYNLEIILVFTQTDKRRLLIYFGTFDWFTVLDFGRIYTFI